MATAGYSGTPLVKKLGIKEGYKCYFKNVPKHYFDLLHGLPEIELCEKLHEELLDFAHLFCLSNEILENELASIKVALKKTGSVWISWPKKSSSIKSDLDGNVVRAFGLDLGLVDVKVAAIDENWSGLKFMYRVQDR